MKLIIRKARVTVNGAPGPRLTVLLVLAVLVPSVCLVWFMTQAVRNERLAVRQRLTEAYQGYLALSRDRLEIAWRQMDEQMQARVDTLSPPAFFAAQVRAGLAEAAVVFDASGNIAYPQPLAPLLPPEPSGEWAEAQRLEVSDVHAAAQAFADLARRATNASESALALQSQARCFARLGSNAMAVAVLSGPLADARHRDATDAQGRLIVPNAQLMTLEFLGHPPGVPATAIRDALKAQLLDYDGIAMPAPQRRFLLREFERLFPEEDTFSLLAAEDLAARFVENDDDRIVAPGLRLSSLPGIWVHPLAGGRVIALHQTEALAARLRAAASSEAVPEGILLDAIPPGQEAGNALLSMPTEQTLGGWRLMLSVNDPRLFDAASRGRVTAYVWTGILVVMLVVALTVLVLGLVRRQAALAQLRNDLVANVSHELKTPLASMRLFVDTLLDSPQWNQQTAREYLELIARENQRLSRLIDNFLMFSRIERNKYTFEFREVSAASIVESAAAAVRKRFDTPACQFNVEAPSSLPVIVADADALVAALVNLLDNAWKYSGDDKQITLRAVVQNGAVRFEVADNGVGLSAPDIKRIFQRFYRVRRHATQPSSGCGLGLNIVQFIVTAHQGSVEVESKPELGSTFTVTLPLGNERRPPEANP